MKKPSLKVKMPGKAAKAAGGRPTHERPQAGKPKDAGLNAPMKKAPVPQAQAKVTYGQPTPTQKL